MHLLPVASAAGALKIWRTHLQRVAASSSMPAVPVAFCLALVSLAAAAVDAAASSGEQRVNDRCVSAPLSFYAPVSSRSS